MNAYPNATHAGLERVLNGSSFLKKMLSGLSFSKDLTKPLMAVATMAAVTFAGRELESIQPGFAAEWAILSIVAVTAFWFFASFVAPTIRSTGKLLSAYSAHRAQIANDERYYQSALRDPRVMNDLLRAQDRSEQV
jgi:hypothetical protein